MIILTSSIQQNCIVFRNKNIEVAIVRFGVVIEVEVELELEWRKFTSTEERGTEVKLRFKSERPYTGSTSTYAGIC